MTATATMQIDPLALSRSDSISTPAASRPTPAPASSATKPTTKIPSSIPRIDFEPIYTDLKVSIGIQWPTYQDAITRFVQGGLNHHEFNAILEPIFNAPDPALCAKIESLHNQLICAILSNIGRDMPDDGVASWVSSNEKPLGAVPKPVSGDAAEQRVKMEVKNLPARDRRRIKAAGMSTTESVLEGLGLPAAKPGVIDVVEMQTTKGLKMKRTYDEFQNAKSIRLPEVTPTSAGGLTKTNWDLEIRKRYTQPLFSETHDIPSEPHPLLSRLQPICYEESLPSGTSLPVAELISVAIETYLKEFLSIVFSRTRCNAPGSTGDACAAMVSGLNAGAGGLGGNVIMTGKYKKQLEKEEVAWKKGEIHRSRETGLLPIESKELSTRRPISINDLKIAVEVGEGMVGDVPLIRHHIWEAWGEGEVEDFKAGRHEYEEWLRKRGRGDGPASGVNGVIDESALAGVAGAVVDGGDAMDLDGPVLDADADAEADADADGDADADANGQGHLVNDDDYGGWEGAGHKDRMALDSILGDILAMK